MKTKDLHELKVADDATGEVTAVFATLNVIDSHGDVTRPGAFSEEDVRISAYGHESWYGQLPVGRGSIKEVGDEAIFTGRFFLDTTAGRDHFNMVKNMTDLQEWSYGFDVLESAQGMQDDRPVTFLDKVKVHEVSPVLLGAGVGTRTLGVKSRDGLKLSEHINAVVTDVELLVTRAADVVTLRANQGKTLGTERAEDLARLETALKRLHDLLPQVKQTHDDNTAEDLENVLANGLRILAS